MKYIIFLFLTGITFGSYAQKGAFGEDIKSEETKIEEKIDEVTGKKVEQIDVNATTKSVEKRAAPSKGKVAFTANKTYSVLLFQSDDPVDITDKRMKGYGQKLFYRQIPEDKYYYMFGEFQLEEDAKKALEMLKMEFPNAAIINDIEHPNVRL